ncbi:uncharacterized protein A4U43_C04F4740 [Asparagus officinalis]|uniref:CTLH domain-containing protein n=1 Tax=Asparagus officinalis TaxID=4686 RepID=A0A5P1EYU4_ASPOF|nr:uncharacterized protein A4U43_C04F4740 [Asparagus officinalis]
MNYFEDEVKNRNWDEVENDLLGFTKADDNRHSVHSFLEIRKLKCLNALDKHDRATAPDILVKDLELFASLNEALFEEITRLLTLGKIINQLPKRRKLPFIRLSSSRRSTQLVQALQVVPYFLPKISVSYIGYAH